MAPEELEHAYECAEIAGGRLPHWHYGHGDAEPPVEYSLGPEFERALAAAKREAAGLPPEPEGGAGAKDGEYGDDGYDDEDEDGENPFLD